MLKPEKDDMDFSVWFPLEFLNENDDQFSLRWVYTELTTNRMFSKYKDMIITKKNLSEI